MVGVGGVTTGRDVWEYLQAGAAVVQAATIYWNSDENPGVFGGILSDYIDHFNEEK